MGSIAINAAAMAANEAKAKQDQQKAEARQQELQQELEGHRQRRKRELAEAAEIDARLSMKAEKAEEEKARKVFLERHRST